VWWAGRTFALGNQSSWTTLNALAFVQVCVLSAHGASIFSRIAHMALVLFLHACRRFTFDTPSFKVASADASVPSVVVRDVMPLGD
jgi:hypothetical protein